MLFVGLNAAAQIFPVKMTLQIPEELSSACFQDFYPIGFSDPALTEGSYFAFFLYKNFSGGLGEHTDFRFYIQDLITDDLVVSYEFRSNRADFTLDILEPAEEALLRKQASEVYALDPLHVWGALAKPIAEVLDQYGIQSNHRLELEPFPFRWADELFLLRIETFFQTEAFYGDYWVALYKSGQLSKRITEAEEVFLISMQSPGVILSPFENRIVVILFKEEPGFEGPPNDLSVLTVGAHLIEGFEPWGGRAYFENQ
jgi:hypothetical protein